MTYEEFLDLDAGQLNTAIVAMQSNRQLTLNDDVIQNIRLAIKISEAVWGGKHVADFQPIELSIDKLDLHKTEKERIYDEAFQKACKQYNIT